MSEQDANVEIQMWRREFLGFSECENEKKLHVYFLSIPSIDLIKKGPIECYKETVKYFLKTLEN